MFTVLVSALALAAIVSVDAAILGRGGARARRERREEADKEAKATCEAPLAEECGHNPPHLLRGVSFVVEPGQTVAIVGGSGSGKSSHAGSFANVSAARSHLPSRTN